MADLTFITKRLSFIKRGVRFATVKLVLFYNLRLTTPLSENNEAIDFVKRL